MRIKEFISSSIDRSSIKERGGSVKVEVEAGAGAGDGKLSQFC